MNTGNNALRDIIYGIKRERVYVEGTTVGGIICPLIKIKQYDVYIYGAGTDISSVVLYFWNLGIEIKGIMDCDPDKDGGMVLDKVPVRLPDKMAEKFDTEKTFVIINTIYFRGIEQNEIISLLRNMGVEKFYALEEYEKNEIKAKPHQWADIGRIEYYRANVTELERTYELLYDIDSKEIMLEFIRVYMQFGTYSLLQCNSDKKYFYGQNSDGSKEELYKHLENEIWVNCGSNNGDNIFWYFANGLTAKDIYAYEADPKIYARLVKNLEYLPLDCRKKIHPKNAVVNEKTVWGNNCNVTLINADIEGGEFNLLKGLKKLIKASRPVLAICAYHKASDLVKIPDYIQSIVDDYCYVLRKYESNVENIRRTAELVLYAIPQERISEVLKAKKI